VIRVIFLIFLLFKNIYEHFYLLKKNYYRLQYNTDNNSVITKCVFLLTYFFPFLNVLRYIEEEDLLRFLKTVEVHSIFPLFEGAVETGKITKSSFRNWVVRSRKPTFFYIYKKWS